MFMFRYHIIYLSNSLNQWHHNHKMLMQNSGFIGSHMNKLYFSHRFHTSIFHYVVSSATSISHFDEYFYSIIIKFLHHNFKLNDHNVRLLMFEDTVILSIHLIESMSQLMIIELSNIPINQMEPKLRTSNQFAVNIHENTI